MHQNHYHSTILSTPTLFTAAERVRKLQPSFYPPPHLLVTNIGGADSKWEIDEGKDGFPDVDSVGRNNGDDEVEPDVCPDGPGGGAEEDGQVLLVADLSERGFSLLIYLRRLIIASYYYYDNGAQTAGNRNQTTNGRRR